MPSAALGTGDVAVKKEKDEGEKERGRKEGSHHGTSLVVWCLRLHAPNAGGPGFDPWSGK